LEQNPAYGYLLLALLSLADGPTLLMKHPHLHGQLHVPGDKSISHRALLFAALGTGTSQLSGLGTGADVRSTAACLRQLGVAIAITGDSAHVDSPGFAQWRSPVQTLDCGNSGTTMRLLTGLLSAHPNLQATLDGDASLRQRPMARVVEPLLTMGARIATQHGKPPLHVTGQRLRGAHHVLPVASAQVKSALLLAGLFAVGETLVTEPAPSRDHTENLLRSLGVALQSVENTHTVSGLGQQAVLPALGAIAVPGDPSSAAFALVAALLHSEGDVTVHGVAQNPTRTGFLRVLERMGARLDVRARSPSAGEPVGDVRARTSALQATAIVPGEVPSLIDELPILALAAAASQGTSHFAGLAELRVKESDRLAAIVRLLEFLGVACASGPDWLTIHGVGDARHFAASQAVYAPGLDHRMAMTAAVANLVSPSALSIPGFAEAISSSWPDFAEAMAALSA
jgi:3-phosphoshikimate 1-carboxyvinyltransferase